MRFYLFGMKKSSAFSSIGMYKRTQVSSSSSSISQLCPIPFVSSANNTARGGFIRESDLYDAIVNGVIFGAGLDVTEQEPLPVDSPLLELENINIFPHIGSATKQAREGMAKVAAENIVAFVEGKPMPTLVNPEIYS